ncbi:Mu-type opioid receptor [Trichinella pseudospiralis]|uniref:Mu-type opioid receptor n=1 Tax=Trichinella pseudospiralis TaxID=6337 RepID=A0A0V1FQS0_TRIPS|nr:Mu-type opioid receptor [Trichinella pseudospiralis]
MIMQNNTTTLLSLLKVQLHFRESLIAGVIILAVALPGLIANVYVIYILLKRRFKNWMPSVPYYGMLMSKCLSDLIILLIYICYCAPVILLRHFTYESIEERIVRWLRQFGYFAGLGQVILIALNRYNGICCPKNYKSLFSPKRTVIMIFSGWLFGFAISAPFLSSMCHYHFLTNMFVWGFLLQYPSSVWFIGVDVFIHLLALITLCILYTFMLQKLKLSSRRFLNRSKELSKRRLVIQAQLTLEAVAMNLSLLVVWIAFYTLPLITLNKWCLLINSCLAILNSSIFALLNLLFKRTLHRQQLRRIKKVKNAQFSNIQDRNQLTTVGMLYFESSMQLMRCFPLYNDSSFVYPDADSPSDGNNNHEDIPIGKLS